MPNTYPVKCMTTDSQGKKVIETIGTYVDDEWIEPVYDRSAVDITEKNTKAFMQYYDWLRIDIDTNYLYDRLYALGYGTQVLVFTRPWDFNSVPYTELQERILYNVRCIGTAMQVAGNLPADMTKLHYTKINAIEECLDKAKENMEHAIDAFRYSGGFNFYSGMDVILP